MDVVLKLQTAPMRIAHAQRAVLEARGGLDEVTRRVETLKASVTRAVTQDTNGAGKPRYPNEQSRSAEIEARLERAADWKAKTEDARRLQRQLDEAKIALDLVVNELRAARSLAQVLDGTAATA